jgi:hypothetical protein
VPSSLFPLVLSQCPRVPTFWHPDILTSRHPLILRSFSCAPSRSHFLWVVLSLLLVHCLTLRLVLFYPSSLLVTSSPTSSLAPRPLVSSTCETRQYVVSLSQPPILSRLHFSTHFSSSLILSFPLGLGKDISSTDYSSHSTASTQGTSSTLGWVVLDSWREERIIALTQQQYQPKVLVLDSWREGRLMWSLPHIWDQRWLSGAGVYLIVHLATHEEWHAHAWSMLGWDTLTKQDTGER